ncbi:hypothetical protein GPECTOR_65g174 [Gonium pectorale]|uniref:Uncharacterized protein n=1 Tax=Gonium pectorale TaxID=33097 RepID=A0A150G3U7_GONPE|nr:hypothetical protein GPECTOR_65g174 [Gonium pectorale]|eukprot:KXZ44556.1 hypothetical protein GPECTOR_65g174 [Gonium pectorale]
MAAADRQAQAESNTELFNGSQQGSGSLPEAEFWALDSDKRVLSTAHSATRLLEVGPGDEASLGQAELTALSGGTLRPAAPEAPDGHAGAVFVLGSAFGSPGGSPMLLQLVRHLRRQGYFVAAALTRPFEFEGARRLEAADTLISTMQEVAHLVVVISQGVLTRASAELTMGQAQAIADNTLVYTVQSTLWALRAPEVLKVSHGAFLWHGRDLRNYKRPLFPPMMNLLSCPGYATLGRGQAALPRPLLQQAGLASALSTLAEDAVKAAAESPFLDNKMESATGVLCVLRVPPSVMGVSSAGGPPRSAAAAAASSNAGGPLTADSHKEHALRSAVQVAAMTVRELVGPHCHDIIVCPQLSHELEADPQLQQQAPAAEVQQQPQPTAGAAAAAGEQVAGAAPAEASGASTLPVQQPVQQPAAAAASALVRVEVSLLILEAIEEAAEARPIARPRGAADGGYTTAAASVSAAAPAAQPLGPSTSSAPAAATARDRMSSVIGGRGSAAPGRLVSPGDGSIFSGQQYPHAASSLSAGGAAAAPAAGIGRATTPSRSGAPLMAGPGIFGGVVGAPLSAQAASTPSAAGAAAPGAATGAAGVAGSAATGAAAGSAATGAAAGSAASDSAAARKQARLAAMSAMSALAGGTAAAAHGGLHGGGGVGGVAGAGGGVSARGTLNARGYPQQQQQQPAQAQQPQQQQQGAQAEEAAGGGLGGKFGFQQIPRMAESLVTSLVAQSLDLPPQAARWRHQLRSPPPSARGNVPSVFQLPKARPDGATQPGVDEDVDGSWIEEATGQGEGLGHGIQQLIAGMRLPGLGGGGGGSGAADDGGDVPAAGPLAVRTRVAGMLDRERADTGTWDAAGTGV